MVDYEIKNEDFEEYVSLDETIKELTNKRDALKEKLFNYMEKNKIGTEDFGPLKATIVKQKDSISLDTKKFQASEPVLYEEVLQKYSRTTIKKPYIKITVK